MHAYASSPITSSARLRLLDVLLSNISWSFGMMVPLKHLILILEHIIGNVSIQASNN
jgi:hypothetical protein